MTTSSMRAIPVILSVNQGPGSGMRVPMSDSEEEGYSEVEEPNLQGGQPSHEGRPN